MQLRRPIGTKEGLYARLHFISCNRNTLSGEMKKQLHNVLDIEGSEIPWSKGPRNLRGCPSHEALLILRTGQLQRGTCERKIERGVKVHVKQMLFGFEQNRCGGS